MLLGEREHDSQRLWVIFGVMSVVNGGLFAFVAENSNHELVKVAALLGIGLCILWFSGQLRITGWVRWWEGRLVEVERGYIQELRSRSVAASTTLPNDYQIFRDRRPPWGLSTRWLGFLLPLLFCGVWIAVLFPTIASRMTSFFRS